MERRKLLSLAALTAVLPLLVRADDRADFAKWWPSFQAAVVNHDVSAIAKGVKFPLNWENGKIREMKSVDDLKQNFNSYFTAEIQKLIATRKPERYPNGVFNITWKARGNEYSLYFKPGPAGTFVLDGLSEGPP